MGLSNFCYDNTSQAVYCVIFGITSGAYVGLTSVVLVDLLGLDKLTNAFGLLLLFQGIASVIGPPFIGKCTQIGQWIPNPNWAVDTGSKLGSGYQTRFGQWILDPNWALDTKPKLGSGYWTQIG